MKWLHLFVFLLTLHASSAQDVFIPQRIKSGTAYQQSFPIGANQPTTLKIQVRNRLSLGSLIKAGAPFAIATAYGLIKQQGTAPRIEGIQPHSSLSPYLLGGALASGASFALTPKRKKIYVELNYRNAIGVLSRTEGHWIDVRKPSFIAIHSSINGSVDVAVRAGTSHALKIQQLGLQTASARQAASSERQGEGKPEDKPKTNAGGDFGIQGGSGTSSDPYLLSSVSVFPEYEYDEFTDYGGGFYFTNGLTYDGNIYPPGYYQDQSVYTPPPYVPPAPKPNDYKYQITTADCAGYNTLYQASTRDGKEMGGVITTDGKLIILPSQNNQINHVDLNESFKDADGHTIVSIYLEDGSWKIDLNDFSTSPGTQTTYTLAAMIHTHPSGVNPATGEQWATYQPSSDDYYVASVYPGLDQYIRTPDSVFGFDENGQNDNFVPGCY